MTLLDPFASLLKQMITISALEQLCAIPCRWEEPVFSKTKISLPALKQRMRVLSVGKKCTCVCGAGAGVTVGQGSV